MFRFGPYFCQPVIAGLGDEDKPFICTMDSLGAKYVDFLPSLFPLHNFYNNQPLKDLRSFTF